ncbi:MAG TPA: hypothetical protein DC057_01115 [Spirochaetia bacterium]|nr:hypothetical protein [Spirochaetia bacterium]
MSHADWLKPLFDSKNLKNCANVIAKQINQDKKSLKIKCIIVTGMSGAIIGGLVSAKTNLPLVVVRKDDKSHSGHNVEFSDDLKNCNACFLDDLISSGNTLERVIVNISRRMWRVKIAKIYLYNDMYNKERYNYGENMNLLEDGGYNGIFDFLNEKYKIFVINASDYFVSKKEEK